MPVPNANATPAEEISMIGVFSEKNEDDYTADNPEESNISLKGLSDNNSADSAGGNINLNANSLSKPDQLAPHGLNEFSQYNHTATPPFEWDNDTLGLGNAPFNVVDSSGSSTTRSIFKFGLTYQANNNRVRMLLQKSSGNGAGVMGTASYITFADYDESDPNTVEAKCFWNGVFTGHSTFTADSYEPSNSSFGGGWTKNTYRTIGTSTADGFTGFTLGEWKVTRGSSLGTAFYKANTATSGQDSPTWTVRAKDSNGTVLDTSNSRTSNSSTFQLSATRSSFGGGGPGFGGDICIHEDHLVETEIGPMHIDDVLMKDPKIWGYNTTYFVPKKELADLIEIRQVPHDNLYTINNTKLTEDHILYAEGHRAVSVNPTKAKENYGKDSEEIKVGDKLMKFDGNLEEVTSITKLDGTHRTYTIKTELDSFYANGILVDSEV